MESERGRKKLNFNGYLYVFDKTSVNKFVNVLEKVDFQKLKESGLFIIWVVGGPGSGKTTLCSKLAENLSFLHISVSDLLTNLVASGTKKGDEFTTLRKSRVIPTSILLFLIKQEMATHRNKKGFLIDGFPVEISQASKFETEIAPSDLILFLKVDESTMIDRIYFRSMVRKGEPEKVTTVSGKIRAFRELEKLLYESFADRIQVVDATLDVTTVERKAAIKINDIIIKYFTMKILQSNNVPKP